MQENKDTNQPKFKEVNYVIVVHGIGEQRLNESVLPVINRFAEARNGFVQSEKNIDDSFNLQNFIPLGMLTSQTGIPKKVGDKLRFIGCKPWIEFNGIPNRPTLAQENSKYRKPFIPTPSNSGENIRFIDFHWADIMQETFTDVGQGLQEWMQSIINRMKERKYLSEIKENENKILPSQEREKELVKLNKALPIWVLPVLGKLQHLLSFVHKLLGFKVPYFDNLIFNNYMGDIQLYGECQFVRGKAVGRFHRMMAKLEKEHKSHHDLDDNYMTKDKQTCIKPKYTIIAHSLGTVMSMDALLSAHIKKSEYANYARKNAKRSIPNFPFEGYLEALNLTADHDEVSEEYKSIDPWFSDETRLGEKWINNVHGYVTLGSPIDKFLSLWWQNYEYVYKHELIKVDQKIKHFNFCDEQDPVGHHLELARNLTEEDILADPACKSDTFFSEIFETKEDQVFNRYPVPGKAHVDYWMDPVLFKYIIERVIDTPSNSMLSFELQNPTSSPEAKINNTEQLETEDKQTSQKHVATPTKNISDPDIYPKILRITYLITPVLFLVGLLISFSWGWFAKGLETKAIAFLVFLAISYLTKEIVGLLIWWRVILFQITPETDENKLDAPFINNKTQSRKVSLWFELMYRNSTLFYIFFISSIIISAFHIRNQELEMTNLLVYGLIPLVLLGIEHFYVKQTRDKALHVENVMPNTFLHLAVFGLGTIFLSSFADTGYIEIFYDKMELLRPYVKTPLIIGLFFISLVWNYCRECYWSARTYFTNARQKEKHSHN